VSDTEVFDFLEIGDFFFEQTGFTWCRREDEQQMANRKETNRRRFMAVFGRVGLGATLVPEILWAKVQEQATPKITLEMVKDALALTGLPFTDAEASNLVNSANNNLDTFERLRNFHIPLDVSPPYHFSALVPGITPNKNKEPFILSKAPVLKKPADLEDIAFLPLRHLAELIRTKQVSSVELTKMYLERLHRYQPKLNFVVTFLDDLGMGQARKADAEIAAGRYKGPLHGIPWGAKDIISAKGYPTTWGTAPFRDRVFDYDASVVEMLRDAGAVLLAKVSTGELASGDNWFGGQTKNPWDPTQGSSGSSAGPASATAAGCIAFGVGSETSGSILSPSARCGLPGLRPTFGRVSRYGIMALSWTQDRIGPLVRYAEDAAIVMQAIAKPDGRDMSVSDIPFNWNANMDIRKLRIGYIKESFDNITDPEAKARNQMVLDILASLGVSRFIPVTITENVTSSRTVGGFNVESTAYFDEFRRTGRMNGSRGGGGGAGSRLTSAVEYVQSQRVRMMMMMDLAKATEDVDVYLVAGGGGGGGGRGAAPAARGGAAGRGRGGARGGGAPATGAAAHSGMANAACYPAMNLPNGFSANGTPTNCTIFGRPFNEAEIIAVAKAYQDVAGFHRMKPTALEG
jgi:Asp-tRNA(Asn)/Glu-tRNA(Gln) amidotransferase A subunit family amidase